MKVKCHNCGYEWDTSSKMEMVTCPSCGYKTPRSGKSTEKISGRSAPESTQRKSSKEVSILSTKRTGIIAVAIILIAGAIGVTMFLGGEAPGEGGTGQGKATIRLASIGGSAPVFATTPDYTGIENIYVVDQGSGYDETSEINATDPEVVGTFTAGDGTETVTVDPENDWSLVVKAQIHKDNVVGLNVENSYVYCSFENNANFSGVTENTLATDNRYKVGSGTGTIEVQHLLDNNGNGYVLQGDQSVDYAIDLWAYIE